MNLTKNFKERRNIVALTLGGDELYARQREPSPAQQLHVGRETHSGHLVAQSWMLQ